LSIEAEINKYNITARLIKHVLDIDIKRNFGSSDFDRLFGFKTTDDLAEGDTNKYFSSDLETDPVFSAWESSTDYLVSGDNVSELENDAGYLTEHQDLSGLVPYAGATDDLDLGANNLTVDTNVLFVDAVNDRVGIGTTAPTEKLEIDGNLFLNGDNDKVILGTGKDASITYDGTNLVINPKEVGSGLLNVQSDMEVDGTTTSEQNRTVGDVDISYNGDFVENITIGSRVITFTNDGNKYTKWEDTDYEWEPTYTDGRLTKLEVTDK
jgi:hypothetical protein